MTGTDDWRNLQHRCFRAARIHFNTLGSDAFLDLPAPILQDLLPHLTVCQLEKLQPRLNQRGISTHSAWLRIYQLIYGRGHALDVVTEDEIKSEIMNLLFMMAFFGYSQSKCINNIIAENGPSLLWMTAKYMRHFRLLTSRPLKLNALTSKERPLLPLLEKNVTSISIGSGFDLEDENNKVILQVLHRLLDHGVATKLRLHCPILLSWLLRRRRSQCMDPDLGNEGHCEGHSRSHPSPSSVPLDESNSCPGVSHHQGRHAVPCKRQKLDCVSVEEEESPKAPFQSDSENLCQSFACEASAHRAHGHIECLDMARIDSQVLVVLVDALPTFYSLRSLTLQSISILHTSDVLSLARALKQLSESNRCCLSELNIGTLPDQVLFERLLDSCPVLKSLHVEIQSLLAQTHFRTQHSDPQGPELSLQRLTVKMTAVHVDAHYITSALRRCPHLVHLHLSGLRLSSGYAQRQLLSTITESNRSLKTLHLEDMKLSDCLGDIVLFLRVCKLENLELNDCRLLEQCNDKEVFMQQLVEALKALPSLHSLSLSNNRLTKYVCVLTQLFSGPSPSSVKHLNIRRPHVHLTDVFSNSSNFIQPAEMLEFAVKLKAHRPPHPLTLQLMKNPGDRDPDTWNSALKMLSSFCELQVEVWRSTDTMVDHIGNM
ncbi:uncharacterized protein lrrc41 isoform X2 [Gouania willdenowi]|uniref:uncharacterized protein lrrc41 isoform X2 n=1 Tax=Gouania willdenowi TaxID=441366 RepID=UPI0010556803|nr:leucine-rich repeat-containing protein 41 isoform X2 [Gouania willdenowi]